MLFVNGCVDYKVHGGLETCFEHGRRMFDNTGTVEGSIAAVERHVVGD